MEITKRDYFIIQLAQISKDARKAFKKHYKTELAQFEKLLLNPVNFDGYLEV